MESFKSSVARSRALQYPTPGRLLGGLLSSSTLVCADVVIQLGVLYQADLGWRSAEELFPTTCGKCWWN